MPSLRTLLAVTLTSAVVGAGSAGASSWINGHSIRPHSIPLNRLAHRPVEKRGPQGPVGSVGPQGPQGDPGIEGDRGLDGSGITNVLFSPIACQNAGGYAVSYGPPNLNGNATGHFTVCNGADGAPGLGNDTLTICLEQDGGIAQAPCAGDAQPVEVVIVSAG